MCSSIRGWARANTVLVMLKGVGKNAEKHASFIQESVDSLDLSIYLALYINHHNSFEKTYLERACINKQNLLPS